MNGAQGICDYCGAVDSTYSIARVADLVEGAFDKYYERTPNEPDDIDFAMLHDRESEYEWEREGTPVLTAICEAAGVQEKVGKEILQVLEDRHYDHRVAEVGEESEFSSEAYYTEKGVGLGEFFELWRDFETGLKTKSRFFSHTAKLALDRILEGISTLRTSDGGGVVLTAGPESSMTILHRARVFACEDDKLKEALSAPWKFLGSPPSNSATAGRMNARGIAVFYGAKDEETALSEVRPPVGSKVATARFEIVRPLQLLDLDAMKSLVAEGSIFDPDTITHKQRANFLEVLSRLLARPVMPNEETIEYLPTQAVADYLANEIQLDGIIFPSTQMGQQSSNVVLFHHAARVKEEELPDGTQVDVCIEMTDSDGTFPHYTVREEVPPIITGAKPSPHSFDLMPIGFDPVDELDIRPITLRIDLASIHIHTVEAVRFRATSLPVHRHRVQQNLKR